ncbi:MAG: carboxypeptidase M32 [Burkholderiaceae bacterium]|nr:carboxypeptidase M32 [Burkholderiaceae bacterium]
MPSRSDTPAYDLLAGTFTRLHHLDHLQAIAYWDQAAMMPAGGAEARAGALAEVATLMHQLRTDPSLKDALARAGDEPLDEQQRANLREIGREWRAANALPESLVQRSQLARSRCEHAWRRQRPANDWAGFLANFREVVAVARDEAALLSQSAGLRPYDALMDRYEPGMRCEQLDRLFADLRQWLPALVQRVQQRQRSEPVIPPQGPFPVEAQRALCLQVMQRLGFDFNAGRLDVSTHPFAGGVPEDVRLTTRYDPAEFVSSLLGAIHETGHGRYEQNLPRDWLGQPVSQARSMAIHESQSLSFEMQLARHPGFVAQLAPMIRAAFGDQPAFADDNLLTLLTRVQPGPIRVDADELTYAAHVVLRYDIERRLIEREVEPEDVPALWDAAMAELLGLDTRGNYRDGPLQDVHWPEALFGYFPCYTLGAMYAAQWFAALRRDQPDLDQRIAAGDLAPVFDWLRRNIWHSASRWPTDELTLRASGEPLNPAHYRAHLESRYLG